jgi:Tol biopolymer transport system component
MRNACNAYRKAILFAIAAVCLALPIRASSQELSKEATDKAAAEARAKRNAQTFENNASVIVFYDRKGQRIGGALGERAMYQGAVISPDGSRVAVVKGDLDNESADVFVLDIKSGGTTRITTSARTEFVQAPIWSPDGSKVAYVAMRKGQEGIYSRPANGQGAEELVWRNPGAFIFLSDWSSDGKTLTFTFSDMKGGTLYTLPLEGAPDRKATEIAKTELQMFGSRFSPDGRFLAYTVVDKANKGEIFVRSADPAASGSPLQVSDGAIGIPFWRRDGKELYYLARDRAVMVADVTTAPSLSSTNRRVLFKPQGSVPEIVRAVSADGERFLVVPPPRGPQLQQLTIFDRTGNVLQKIGEPGLYSQPSFSPDGARLLVVKNDIQSAQADYWTIELATGKPTRLTNDTYGKQAALWSPDGKYIYYSSFRNGDFPLYRRLSDGTGGEEFIFQYTPGAFLGPTDISPDGKWLICDAGGYLISVPLTGDAKSRKEVETLRDEFLNTIGRLSPDGNFMAYRSDEAQPERGEIYVRPFKASSAETGDGKWRLSKDGVIAMLHWHGKEVFWRGQNLESNDLWVMSVDVTTSPTFSVGTPKMLFKLPGPIAGNLGNISRDGQRFVFAVNVSAPAPTTVPR